jgi:type II restriction enzyme
MTRQKLLKTALIVLKELGLPKEQQNERSALCLLAILDLQPGKRWRDASNPLIGITPMMDWIRLHYKKAYAPNSRETVRRFTMHQFVSAGIAVYNPDKPERPVNSPNAVYQVAQTAFALLREVGSPQWKSLWEGYSAQRETLMSSYARVRDSVRVPVKLQEGRQLALTPGPHSELIRDIIEIFGSIFVRDAQLVYAGDTGDKWGYFDSDAMQSVGIEVEPHGKMPDVILLDRARNWLVLVEAVTSHGPVDGKRHAELSNLFAGSSAGIVFVTAFPTRTLMSRYLPQIAWETEVWVTESPTHLIHFNGDRFLGPHSSN